jgi:CDP-diglyceride synthetase
VEYQFKDKAYYRQINIDVSIFPSLGSMLFGTILGSLLGTIAHDILANTFSIGCKFLPGRVQPFLTVEDFWGGILLGFLVGYVGQQFLTTLLPSGLGIGNNATTQY